MEPVIEVKNLTKIYGKRSTAFTALKDVSFAINPGESVAIVGKSGSGKSTLMHLLALLDRPTSGEVIVNGTSAKTLKNRQLNHLRNQNFGFVFQQFFMNPRDSVLENIMLPLKIAGVRRKIRKAEALKAIKVVGLEQFAKQKAKNLSGGQKQRVCIARALVNHPKVIFADEPTGNLDSATGEKIIKLLFDLNQKQGTTLVIVTHDEELAAMCGRKIRISDGKLAKVASKISEPSKKQGSKRQNLTSKPAKLTRKPTKHASKLKQETSK